MMGLWGIQVLKTKLTNFGLLEVRWLMGPVSGGGSPERAASERWKKRVMT